MIEHIDIRHTFSVPVFSAGAEDDIDLDVVLEVAMDDAGDEVWLEGVRRLDGAPVSTFDSLFMAAETWVDEMAGAILNKEYH